MNAILADLEWRLHLMLAMGMVHYVFVNYRIKSLAHHQ